MSCMRGVSYPSRHSRWETGRGREGGLTYRAAVQLTISGDFSAYIRREKKEEVGCCYYCVAVGEDGVVRSEVMV